MGRRVESEGWRYLIGLAIALAIVAGLYLMGWVK